MVEYEYPIQKPTMKRRDEMNKILLLVVFLCICLSGCNKNNSSFNSEINSQVTIDRAFYTVTIDDFKEKYNAAVTKDTIKINNWSERMPGIVDFTFNNQITLSLGSSPNAENFVRIPQLYSDIVEISKIDDFPEILYGILKVEDDTITLEQAESAATKLSLDEVEMMTVELPYTVHSKEETIHNIRVDASYLEGKLHIMFYDSNMSGKEY